MVIFSKGEAERAQVLAVANALRFAAVPPVRIVRMLADEGIYLASESTFSRVLKAQGQTAHRGRAKAPKARRPPTTHIASGPRQVWCWDITHLPAQGLGRWFQLYLILDLYSRKIVGWEVHDRDHADHAAHLVRRTAPPAIDTPGRKHPATTCALKSSLGRRRRREGRGKTTVVSMCPPNLSWMRWHTSQHSLSNVVA